MMRAMTKALKLPDELRLELKSNYFKTEDDPDAVAYCETRNALYEKAKVGKLYVKFVDGDRKGSIARVQLDPNQNENYAEIINGYGSWNRESTYEVKNQWIWGTAKWDKRKNSCQIHVPSHELVILPNYEGPTIYEMFDRKAAKEALIKNPDQRDIDGKVLAVGDKVLYINARYGSGFVLCHGTIKEFKVSADSKGHAFTTIVTLDGDDMESSISYPSQMIWKK